MGDERPQFEDLFAPYAVFAAQTRGRVVQEPESPFRSPYQRDRDRLIHSSAFRRLKHKTQVFVYHEGDHYRTRLTHSLEVAQISRSVCRTLNLNEDLAEALSLAHDLGHPPFGHAGEDALNLAMADIGGFDHNAQALRLVTSLERRYAAFNGLNLSWECLEGMAKHNGPQVDKKIDHKNPPESLAFGMREFLPSFDLELHTYASAEAQVAALADDIAYSSHDLDDGLRAHLFEIDELKRIGVVGQLIDEVKWTYPNASNDILIHELVRRLINRMVGDLTIESKRRLAELKPKTAQDIRNWDRPAIAFSMEMELAVKSLKAFLHQRMYKHYLVNRMASKAKRVVTDLFSLYVSEPEVLPTEWAERTNGADTQETARVVADFIAGMTDRFAFREHSKLFDLSDVSV